MPQSTLGVGFIGAGAVTQAIHLPTLARLTEQFQVRQVFDVVPEVAARVADRVGAASTSSLEQLLAEPAVEVVAICSPHHLHAEQVIAACRAGKRAVLCEKPFAVSAEEATEIAAVSDETGVPILVGAMHTFDPGWRAAVEVWGDLPTSAFAIRSSIVLPPNSRFEDFATEVINRGGGFPVPDSIEAEAAMVSGGILGLAIHDLPLIRSLLPHFEDLTVLEARFLPPVGYQVVCTAAGRRIELHARLSDTWRPAWTLEVVAPDRVLHTEFTPSYVHAGSAVSTLSGGTAAVTYGPYDSNGYEAEWRELAEIVHGLRSAPEPSRLIDDLRFALSLADAAADAVRRPVDHRSVIHQCTREDVPA